MKTTLFTLSPVVRHPAFVSIGYEKLKRMADSFKTELARTKRPAGKVL
jgi:hypothetical protein